MTDANEVDSQQRARNNEGYAIYAPSEPTKRCRGHKRPRHTKGSADNEAAGGNELYLPTSHVNLRSPFDPTW